MASDLGSPEFKAAYGAKYAYCAGAMYKGIASVDMVVSMGRAGLMSFYGTGGLRPERIESAIREIQTRLAPNSPYGMNLLHSPLQPELEDRTVDLIIQHQVRFIEAAAFTHIRPSLVRYRLTGVRRRSDGTIAIPNRVMAKISRPEVARAFMSPPPMDIVAHLLLRGQLTEEEAELSWLIPLADDICVEADSGGHTDQGVANVLLPTILSVRNEIVKQFQYRRSILVGAAGGIGTPQAAAAAFVTGADFIVTGSINQCTIEAGTSDAVKDMLQAAGIQDTEHAPAGDMFELGAKVQVLKKGTFFSGRANKLYSLYLNHGSIDEIDSKTRAHIEEKYFKQPIESVWHETKDHYLRTGRATEEELESNAKKKMALIFRWYFVHSARLAMSGDARQSVNFQIHCGPALGSFNQWVKNTPLELWRHRRAADIALRIMDSAADHLETWYRRFS